MQEEILKSNLQPVEKFKEKIIQLFDITTIRFGFCLVGPTGSGKTTAYQVLARIRTTLRANGSEDERYVEKALLAAAASTANTRYAPPSTPPTPPPTTLYY
jgi:ABC-type cobalamin/Fe3+-siderophores transport system ATPase subunit